VVPGDEFSPVGKLTPSPRLDLRKDCQWTGSQWEKLERREKKGMFEEKGGNQRLERNSKKKR